MNSDTSCRTATELYLDGDSTHAEGEAKALASYRLIPPRYVPRTYPLAFDVSKCRCDFSPARTGTVMVLPVTGMGQVA